MVPWEWNVAGHTFSFNVFVPALVPLGVIFTGAALWPFIEQWITGDKREHHVNDRPRNAPTRTAIGIAVIAFYGVLWLEGANDVIAYQLNIPLYTTTRIAQVSIFVAPVLAYILTKRVCLGLQRKDNHLLEHGVETGIIRQLPSGEFIEVTRPVSENAHAVLASRKPPPSMPALDSADDNGIPAPGSRHALGKVRARLNTILTEGVEPPSSNGHANGHGNGRSGHGGGQGEPAHATIQAGATPSGGSRQTGGTDPSPADSGGTGNGAGHDEADQ
jgi:ubiquinol-cytochrome c reductase cytochrome b subunit